jgi:prevent-host-death family protein
MADLATITLRDANQRFSELVREVEATGQGFVVLRHGKPVARLLPVEDRPARLTPEQRAAMARLLSVNSPVGIARFDREEAYSERLERVAGGG